MAADAPLKPARWHRLAPAGDPLASGSLGAMLRDPAPAETLARGLEDVLGPGRLVLHQSGRDALRAALVELARQSARSEVVLPAYTCFSVPAAAVAAGLRVRLVDVDDAGRVDPAALAKLPLERAAAVVVCNLFGAAEPIAAVRRIASAAGAALVDDAAQALGARDDDGPAGARGDVGILSFARGKPLSGLGGGARFIAGKGEPLARGDSAGGDARTAARVGAGARGAAALRALGFAIARDPRVFGWLAALPFLAIGETPFEPGFLRGPIRRASLVLAAADVPRFRDRAAERLGRARTLARAVEAATPFRSLLPAAPEGSVAPRLALRAPDGSARAAALCRLDALGAGASALYPSALDSVPGLAAHLVGETRLPGARALAACLLTLPLHGGLAGALLARSIEALRAAARGTP